VAFCTQTAFPHPKHDCEIIRKVLGDVQGGGKPYDLDGVNRVVPTSVRAPVSGGIKTHREGAIYDDWCREPRCSRIHFLAKLGGGLHPYSRITNSDRPLHLNRDVVTHGTRGVSLGGLKMGRPPCRFRNISTFQPETAVLCSPKRREIGLDPQWRVGNFRATTLRTAI
jgi:hypothetical protein